MKERGNDKGHGKLKKMEVKRARFWALMKRCDLSFQSLTQGLNATFSYFISVSPQERATRTARGKGKICGIFIFIFIFFLGWRCGVKNINRQKKLSMRVLEKRKAKANHQGSLRKWSIFPKFTF